MLALNTMLAATSWQRLALGLDVLLVSCGVLCRGVLCCAVQLRSEYNSRGQLVFRGPRLRIGLCEGVPRTVMPDHLGRCVKVGGVKGKDRGVWWCSNSVCLGRHTLYHLVRRQ